MSPKSDYLQIRISPGQKTALRRLAKQAGQDLSAYVLSRALPEARHRFDEIVAGLRDEVHRRLALAALNDLLTSMSATSLSEAVSAEPGALRDLSPFVQNYVAAMVEQACQRRGAAIPPWTGRIPALESPHFATTLVTLRPHLLRAAPVAFKRRNIFVDAGIGAHV